MSLTSQVLVYALPALFLVVYVLAFRRSGGGDIPLAIAEAATCFLLGYAVVGAVLAALGEFAHLVVSGILLVPVVARGVSAWRRGPPATAGRGGTWRRRILLVALMAWTLPVVAARFEFFEMAVDPGVYTSHAKGLLKDGGGHYLPPAPDQFSGEVLTAYVRTNFSSPRRFLPGVMCAEAYGLHSCEYQFLPGWASILALGAVTFGAVSMHQVMVPVALLVVFWVFHLCARWMSDLRAFWVAAAFGVLPLFVYFSKYPTSEVFLLLGVLFLIDVHLRGDLAGRILGLLPLAALVVTHISGFLYLPVLFVYGIIVARRSSRAELGVFAVACLIYAASLPLAQHLSPMYVDGVFGRAFGARLPVSVPMIPPLLAVAVALFPLTVTIARGFLRAETT